MARAGMPVEQHERIQFRLFRMPCCGQLVCWVNPRSPNHCPECGENVFLTIKQSTIFRDDDAMLTFTKEVPGWQEIRSHG